MSPHSFTSRQHYFGISHAVNTCEASGSSSNSCFIQHTCWNPRPTGAWWNQQSCVTSDSLKHKPNVSLECKDQMRLGEITCWMCTHCPSWKWLWKWHFNSRARNYIKLCWTLYSGFVIVTVNQFEISQSAVIWASTVAASLLPETLLFWLHPKHLTCRYGEEKKKNYNNL